VRTRQLWRNAGFMTALPVAYKEQELHVQGDVGSGLRGTSALQGMY